MTINRPNKPLIAAAALALFGATAFAAGNSAVSPYAGEQQRTIKAMSAQDMADLEAGRGMGLSKVAELNHFPGPKHVLELADALRLSDSQMRQIRQQQDDMQQQAQRLGREIVDREAALDAIFATRRADEPAVRTLLAEIGQLQGELRFVHVNAHLATTHLLSDEQIAAYDRLRGYANGSAPAHPHHH